MSYSVLSVLQYNQSMNESMSLSLSFSLEIVVSLSRIVLFQINGADISARPCNPMLHTHAFSGANVFFVSSSSAKQVVQAGCKFVKPTRHFYKEKSLAAAQDAS